MWRWGTKLDVDPPAPRPAESRSSGDHHRSQPDAADPSARTRCGGHDGRQRRARLGVHARCPGWSASAGPSSCWTARLPIPALTASDGRAAWLGELQQSAEMGPLPAALRTGRPMLTADLTRIGPPALAAAAAECGLVSSLALPIEHDGERLGAVQLLGGAWRPVEAADGETLRPLLDVLAARLVDVRALGAVARPQAVPGSADAVAASPHEAQDVANTCEATTRSLPVVHAADAPRHSPPSSSSTTPRSFAPPLVPA